MFENVKKFISRHIFSILCFIAISYLSLAKFENVPATPMIPYLDKIVHMLMYGGFSFTILFDKARHYKDNHPADKQKSGYFGVNTLWYAILMSTTVGIAMEFAQYYFTTYRGFETEDILADFFGALAGAYVSSYIMKFIIKIWKKIFRKS